MLLGIFDFNDTHLTLTVCRRHRSMFGIRWRCNKTRCTVPSALAVHGLAGSQGQIGLKSSLSKHIFISTEMLLPVGSRMCLCSF